MKRKKEFIVQEEKDTEPIRSLRSPVHAVDTPDSHEDTEELSQYSTQEYYVKSYMHRDVCSHVLVSSANDFVITASIDGHIKFWKIVEYALTNCGELEFVKDFRAHMSSITSIQMNRDSKILASVSKDDKSLKIFHILTFDMIYMIRLDYSPSCLTFALNEFMVVSSNDHGALYVYDTDSFNMLYCDERLHKTPVKVMTGHPTIGLLTIDTCGFIEYSCVDYTGINPIKPPLVKFQSKLDTDLYALLDQRNGIEGSAVMAKFSPNGKLFTISLDTGCLLLFRTCTCKIITNINDLVVRDNLPSSATGGDVEKTRRRIVEEEFIRSSCPFSIDFDDYNDILFYPNANGIQIVQINDDSVQQIGTIGIHESIRFTHVAVWAEKPQIFLNKRHMRDRRVYALAWKKNRVYVFTNSSTLAVDYERRDVCNERPGTQLTGSSQSNDNKDDSDETLNLPPAAIIHTTLGDIYVQLYPTECPKSVQNFCGLSSSGYYNGNIFHRVIRQFMVQTGDPLGTGAGGQSIWKEDFEDEICASLRHDRPYTLSMANAGPNTNGSQFFITVVSCPWLDDKHTIFGRVTKGMDVVHKINNVKTDKQDKPLDEIRILSISLK